MESTKIDYLKEITTLDGAVPFLKDIWNFFNTKGMKTVYISLNAFNSFAVDLEVTENLGCPLHLLFDTTEIEDRWKTLQQTLKERKIADEHKHLDWLEPVKKRWILARNLKTSRVEYSWQTVKAYCKENQLEQIDFLKMEGINENEKMILYSLFDAGYRPSLLLIRWSADPDASVPSMLAAGHLQNVGYRLLSEQNGYFLYLFTDVCMYDTCSWRDTKTQNPMIEYFLKLGSNDSSKETSEEVAEKKDSE